MEYNKAKALIFKEALDQATAKAIGEEADAITEKINYLQDKCQRVVDELKKIDEANLLYSTSKMGLAVPYPTPKFSGATGENVVIWLDKMRQALEDNQVSKVKKVTILETILKEKQKS